MLVISAVIIMVEFCPECWNKIKEAKGTPSKYVFLRVELCEAWGEGKSMIAQRVNSMMCVHFSLFSFPSKVLFYFEDREEDPGPS